MNTLLVQQHISTLRDKLLHKEWYLTTAESCTGGEIAARLTDIPGSSQWFERGFITYSNAAKQEMLGVSSQTLEQYGAVSEESAREMAQGALKHSRAQCAIAVTGIAGPDGGSTGKPVGMVCFAFANINNKLFSTTQHFSGDRLEIREKTVIFALEEMICFLEK
ncbi:MAG: damage-inducible protein CinA [Gammaproteobacteria bacterium]|jgi:nicotinamide-nucleotide amidase|nr:damage-inducible protein CinA [Gammaproteobacteria bacterium]